ncbi:hypothetical protein QZH41_008195, partial [Actinostola sp. cb2023]
MHRTLHYRSHRGCCILQVSFQGTYGASDTANIALDEINFVENFTESCDAQIQYANQRHNCSFNGTLCGWRNVSNKLYMDGLYWKLGNVSVLDGSISRQG